MLNSLTLYSHTLSAPNDNESDGAISGYDGAMIEKIGI
jgi:hypothetical protein